MISAHDGPDFSVTRRLPDAAALDAFPHPLEVRLLAIERAERNHTVLSGLLWQVFRFAQESAASHLLISAITERAPMYRKLGFRPLGPGVAEGAASFIPMVMDMSDIASASSGRAKLHQRSWYRRKWYRRNCSEPLSLMPGPVAIHPKVAAAFTAPPVSHRSPAFVARYEQSRTRLRTFLPGADVVLFPGGGTLANDIVAANLKALFGDRPGVVLSNGEFGDRLADQATRAGLSHTLIRSAWGQPWRWDVLEQTLAARPAWIWAVHLETSTGALNDVASLLQVAKNAECAVALDCVSSLGAAPLPHASKLSFASGVSGKSLGSYAGLGMVYFSEEAARGLVAKTLCPSFDLLHMRRVSGPATTIPSSTFLALAQALENDYATPDAMQQKFTHAASLGRCVRRQLAQMGITPIAASSIAAPHISTFALPYPAFPEECLRAGYRIAFESAYLRKRGWGQIATMGDVTAEKLEPLFHALQRSSRTRTTCVSRMPLPASAIHSRYP